MNLRRVGTALALTVLALLIQTTLFGDGRIAPFGTSPNLVLLVVIVLGVFLESEPALLMGFTAGLLMDLLGGAPLGLWAMSCVVASYLTLRLRDRIDDGVLIVALGIFLLSFAGQALFALSGTLFAQQVLVDPRWYQTIVLPAAYNVALASLVVPLISRLMGGLVARRMS